MEAINQEHLYVDVFAYYGIPKLSLRDHISGKIRSKKMGPQGMLTEEEKSALYEYIEEVVNQGMSLTPIQIKK